MLSNRYLPIFLLICNIILWSCAPEKRVDSEAVKKEMRDREAKKVTEAEIVKKVHEIGDAIALNARKTLGENLQNALQQGGVENAIGYCNLNAMPLVDSLSTYFDASIRRVTLKARNLQDLPDDLERKLLEAYAFQWRDSISLKTNVQAIENDTYLFTKPILVDNALCLVCHGSLDNGLSRKTRDFIRSKYPEDQATDYQIGDFRGMWSIKIAKKKIVLSM